MRYGFTDLHNKAQVETRAAILWSRMTPKQLERLHRHAWEKLIQRSGCSSWDWPTLGMVYPEFSNAFKVIETAHHYAN